jgi:tRNA 2-thiouridine synthesizing protein A
MIELDLTGLNCPLPVLKTKKFLANLESGTQVAILTTDPASIDDLADFCSKSGNLLLSQSQHEQIITTVINRK